MLGSQWARGATLAVTSQQRKAEALELRDAYDQLVSAVGPTN